MTALDIQKEEDDKIGYIAEVAEDHIRDSIADQFDVRMEDCSFGYEYGSISGTHSAYSTSIEGPDGEFTIDDVLQGNEVRDIWAIIGGFARLFEDDSKAWFGVHDDADAAVELRLIGIEIRDVDEYSRWSDPDPDKRELVVDLTVEISDQE